MAVFTVCKHLTGLTPTPVARALEKFTLKKKKEKKSSFSFKTTFNQRPFHLFQRAEVKVMKVTG